MLDVIKESSIKSKSINSYKTTNVSSYSNYSRNV